MASDAISNSSLMLVNLSVIDIVSNGAMHALNHLLKHAIINGSTMTASEYITPNSHVLTDSEWNDNSEKFVIFSIDSRTNEFEDDEEERELDQAERHLF